MGGILELEAAPKGKPSYHHLPTDGEPLGQQNGFFGPQLISSPQPCPHAELRTRCSSARRHHRALTALCLPGAHAVAELQKELAWATNSLARLKAQDPPMQPKSHHLPWVSGKKEPCLLICAFSLSFNHYML